MRKIKIALILLWLAVGFYGAYRIDIEGDRNSYAAICVFAGLMAGIRIGELQPEPVDKKVEE